MLDSCILGMTYSSAYGSGALKVLQNDNIPEIDLLVREAIQNSSDASLKEQEKFFTVNFRYHEFCPQTLNALFSDIGGILNERYSDSVADYLEIRDSKTSGLTGNVHIKEVDPNDHGNYFKLVFDTGKEQTNNDGGKAGGSWGYGKSVYFRVGMGLVIFYSRIKTESGYESRLIASLVERESSTGAILTQIKKDSIGRAWWGIKSGDNEILPLTDEEEIKKILDIFDLEPFADNETGTSIIIPYIDKKHLMQDIFPDTCGIPDDIIAMCTFKDDIVEYTKLAAQKWYAPKLGNKNLATYSDQKMLMVRVNDEPLRFQDMRPFFQLIQELYTSALSANKCGKQTYVSPLFDGIQSVEIPSNKIVGGKSGFVSTVIVTGSDLGNGGAIIPPQAYLRIFGALSNNDPIVTFARAAGIVLDYKVDGKWTKGISKPEGDDAFLVSFYVPDCDAQVRKDVWESGSEKNDFGEYLRRCEKSDHMDWNDISKLAIVTNVARQVTGKINNCYKKQDTSENAGAASRLSGKLGRRLLPQINYGKKKTSGGGGGEGGGGKSNNLDVWFSQGKYSKNTVSMSFSLTFKNEKKKAFIGIFVETEVGMMDAKAWETEIKTPFPISVPIIGEMKTLAVNSKQTYTFESSCGPEYRTASCEVSSVEVVYTEKGNVLGVRVSNEITNAVVTGTIVLESSDKKYCCTLKESKE